MAWRVEVPHTLKIYFLGSCNVSTLDALLFTTEKVTGDSGNGGNSNPHIKHDAKIFRVVFVPH